MPYYFLCSPKPPDVEPDYGRFEDIGGLWVTIPAKKRKSEVRLFW
jgi:hypothetical protein